MLGSLAKFDVRAADVAPIFVVDAPVEVVSWPFFTS